MIRWEIFYKICSINKTGSNLHLFDKEEYNEYKNTGYIHRKNMEVTDMQFTTLQKDMMQAMKDHDKARKDAISTLVSAAKKLAIDAGCRDNIPDDMTDQAILKEIKSVKEQIETCPDSRADLKAEYETRLKVFEEYAPKMLSGDEVTAILKEKFADVIATGNKGQIMKAVMAELKGKADGKVINEAVAKLMK